MEMTKKTSELLGFINVAQSFMQVAGDTKLANIVKKQAKVIQLELESYNSDLEDLRIEHCSVDEKNNVIRDEKNGYVFSKDGLKSLTSENRVLLTKEVTLGVFLKSEDLKDCKEPYNEYFTEFITEPIN